MATGKTNNYFCRFYADGFDLSGDARGFGSVSLEFDEIEQDGWSSGIKYFGLGRPAINLAGFQALFDNDASVGAYAGLQPRSTDIVTLAFGVRAAPLTGDQAFMSKLENRSLKVEGSGGMVMTADYSGPSAAETNLPIRCFGKLLMPRTTLATSGSGSNVQEAALSSLGALGFLHVVATSSGLFSVLKIEHSTNGSAWADLITFTMNGGTVGAEMGWAAGTVNAYTRFTYVRTSGSADFVCGIVRV